jgi:hypothetical protein
MIQHQNRILNVGYRYVNEHIIAVNEENEVNKQLLAKVHKEQLEVINLRQQQ